MNKNTRLKKVESINRPSGDFFKTKPANLVLEDGKVFSGDIPVWQNDSDVAEVIFNSGMTGYVESLTDPSYSEQILTFTYPLIGNYGVHETNWESEKIYAKGVVLSNLVNDWSHPLSSYSFLRWLKKQNVPVIQNVDTRALTQHLRTKGAENGYIVSDTVMRNFKVNKPLVSIHKPKLYKTKGATKTIVLIDCGAKENIVRSLMSKKLNVLRVPFDYNLANEHYDGVMLSNGPGDPVDYSPSIQTVKKLLLEDKPVFGICLGSQLMSLAAGAKTYKLKFGHHGHNQPCRDMKTGKCYITSQNHGYAVKAKTLPKDWEVYFYNLNDGSVEGIIHRTKPFFSVQFHPEAAPGPTDTSWLFDKFVEML